MKPDAMLATNCKSLIIVLCIALAVITSAVYMQVGEHQFLNFDDNTYVTDNSHVAGGLTASTIIWAFTSVEAANWHPITWLSHMADVQLFGMNPRGHHLTNVAIHIASTLSLFLLLVRLTGGVWQSAFVAALFALHPLHVESVAWVAERKDVLSAFFWFLTLLLYAEYVAKRKQSLYLLALCSFVLGLMSKPMLVTLPVIMLLIDFWPLGRYRDIEPGRPQFIRRAIDLIKEKIPFFVCSLLSAMVTIYAQHQGGAITGINVVSFQLRGENALVAYVQYIGKTLWPSDLALLYPYPMSIPLWHVIASLLILLFISIATSRVAKRHPYLMVGWCWFLITLVPVIGLIQVGRQSMADRYSYIPVIGLFIMAAWGVSNLVKGLLYRHVLLSLLAAFIIIASALLTWQQLGYWRDCITLYRHTLQVTADSDVIHNNLGAALRDKGDLDAAIQEFQEALRINSNNMDAHFNLRVVLQAKEDRSSAIRIYQEMLRINPDNKNAHMNLGAALISQGDLDAAIQEYREALRISPNDTSAQNNLELVIALKKRQDETRKSLSP